MSNERGPQVSLVHERASDGEENIGFDKLVEHLQEMGLETTQLNPSYTDFVKFKIREDNGSVKIEVTPPNGILTTCELYKAGRNDKSGIYLYINIEIKSEPFSEPKYPQVTGTFPIPITNIFSEHSIYGRNEIRFWTDGFGGVSLNEKGNIGLLPGV